MGAASPERPGGMDRHRSRSVHPPAEGGTPGVGDRILVWLVGSSALSREPAIGSTRVLERARSLPAPGRATRVEDHARDLPGLRVDRDELATRVDLDELW